MKRYIPVLKFRKGTFVQLKLSVQDPAPVVEGDTPSDALNKTIDLARLVDEIGYTRFWMNEHHGIPSLASIAPEVILARIGAETTNIRLGLGGLILPNYAPLKVAEIFRTLHTLHPDRVDLGIARSAGTPIPPSALRRERRTEPTDDYSEQLQELLNFLGLDSFQIGDPFSNIQVAPNTPGTASVWMLGSSSRSSTMAARFGLPYAYSHFHNPVSTREAIECYKNSFMPAHGYQSPRCVVFIGVLCAETHGDAERLQSSMRLFLQRAKAGQVPQFEEPSRALRKLALSQDNAASLEWPHFMVGTPDLVSRGLHEMAEALNVEEFILQTICWDHAARLRSYKLLASEMNLTDPIQPK